MKAVKFIFNFYLDASVHVALAIYALVQISYIFFGVEPYDHLLWFLFFGSISCYNFVKYGVEAKKYIVVANTYHKYIQYFSLFTLLIAGYHAHFFNTEVYIAIAILVLLTGFYALPLLPKAKNLRSFGGLKIGVVALVWTGATVFLPLLSAEEPLAWDHNIEGVQRFLIVLVLLLPFEVRDLQYDTAALRTLPQRVGIANTKRIGGLFTLLFFLLTWLKDDLSQFELLTKLLLTVLLLALLFATKANQGSYYASFWVEAVPIFWWGLLLLLQFYK